MKYVCKAQMATAYSYRVQTSVGETPSFGALEFLLGNFSGLCFHCHDIFWRVVLILLLLIRGQAAAIFQSCFLLICGAKLECDSLVIVQWPN